MKARIRNTLIVITLLPLIALFVIWMHDNSVFVGNMHCVSGGQFINGAKTEWAMIHHATNGAVVTMEDIAPYGGRWVCTRGGAIVIGKIDEHPTCTFHGDIEPGAHLTRAEPTILFYKNVKW